MRFLNTVGGGRVARITADTAWVEDADGFEIPTPLKDCVVVEAGDTFIPEIRPPKIIQEKLRQGRTEPAAPAPSEVRRPAAPAPRPARPLRAGEDELTVQLAFLPQDRAKLGLTNYEAYLVNDSGFTLYYVYLSAVGTGYKVRSTGTIEPHGDAFLEEFAPADLNDLEQLAIQILPFHDAGITKLQNPLSVRLKLDVTKFFKLHSFRPNDYFTDDALMLPIIERGAEQAQPEVDASALASALQTKKEDKKPAPKAAPSAPRRDEPLVVDSMLRRSLRRRQVCRAQISMTISVTTSTARCRRIYGSVGVRSSSSMGRGMVSSEPLSSVSYDASTPRAASRMHPSRSTATALRK